MNWRTWFDKFDELFASFARPYQVYVCSTSLAASLPLAIYLKAGDITIAALSGSVAGVAGYTGYLRTADKKIAAGATVTATAPTGATVTATTPAAP